MKVFIWYAADHEKEETLKVYAVAEDIAAARAQVLKTLPHQLHAQFMKTEPQSVWDVPFAEVNTSRRGRATAVVAANPVGGTMAVH